MTKTILLQELRNNARKSFAKIGREHKLSTDKIFETYDELKKEPITKHVTLIDFKKIGYGQRNLLLIKAKKKEQLQKFLKQHSNINNIHSVKEFDLSCETIFKNMKEYYEFLEQLELFQLNKIIDYEVVEDLKRETLHPKF
jgi:DNA-binding Lrp family transcriptional regulator